MTARSLLNPCDLLGVGSCVGWNFAASRLQNVNHLLDSIRSEKETGRVSSTFDISTDNDRSKVRTSYRYSSWKCEAFKHFQSYYNAESFAQTSISSFV